MSHARRPRIRLREGSALLFLLAIVVCTSVGLLTLIALAGNINSSVTRREQQTRADFAMQGAVAEVRAASGSGNLTVPNTQTYTIDGFPCVTTVTDNGANIANSYKIVVTTSRWNRSYSLTRITGLPSGVANSIYQYAVALNSACTMTQKVMTYDAGRTADLYSRGGLTLSVSGSTVQGDADLTQVPSGNALTLTGSLNSSYPARTWPTLSDSAYQAAADFSFGSYSIGSISFPSPYTLAVVNGDLNLYGGSIDGKGTVYVTGNVTISGNLSYYDSSSRFAVICKGTISFTTTNLSIVGIYFTNNIIWGSGDTITKGLLCVTAPTIFSRTLSVTFDSGIATGGSEGKNMHLPGLWP